MRRSRNCSRRTVLQTFTSLGTCAFAGIAVPQQQPQRPALPRTPGPPPDGYLITVRGPIPANQMGITLPHEHILITHASVQHTFNRAFEVDLTDTDMAAREVSLYAKAGGKTIIDMTNIGIGRNAPALRRISDKTGIHVVMGTGYYKNGWLPPEVDEMSVEDLMGYMVQDIEVGVDGTGLRAGVIGELGMSRPRTATESRFLRAAARVQQRTGVAISIHFDVNGALEEHMGALDVLAVEKADLSRVVLGHFVPKKAALEHFMKVAQRGCYVEFDLFGQGTWPRGGWGTSLEEQLDGIKLCIDKGLARQMLMSQDVCNKRYLTENGGRGYAHILQDLVPRLREVGVTDQDLRTIMQENPQRLFPVRRAIA